MAFPKLRLAYSLPTALLLGDAALLLTAAIWGAGFVAQRLGMRTLGPFAYNAARFGLGSLVLFLLFSSHRAWRRALWHSGGWLWGAAAGFWLFAAASTQQVGLVTTSAGKAGLLTSLYTLWVYVFDRIRGRQGGGTAAFAVALSLVGLGLLHYNPNEAWAWKPGDAWVLLGSVLWAVHVHWIDRAMARVPLPPFVLAQFGLTALVSGLVAGLWEHPTQAALLQTWGPILYGGLVSVGVAYTLQVWGQKFAPPTHAALLLSMEAPFGILAGTWLLDEPLTPQALVGSSLVVLGVMLSGYDLARASGQPGV